MIRDDEKQHHHCEGLADQDSDMFRIALVADGWELRDDYEGSRYEIKFCPYCGVKLETPK